MTGRRNFDLNVHIFREREFLFLFSPVFLLYSFLKETEGKNRAIHSNDAIDGTYQDSIDTIHTIDDYLVTIDGGKLRGVSSARSAKVIMRH